MNLQEALAKITGVTERLEKLTAENSTAQADLQAARTQISELEAKLKDAPSAEALKAEQDKAVTLAAEKEAEKIRADKAEADLKAEQEAIPGKVNAEAARLVASNGFKGDINTAGGAAEKQSQNSTATRADFSGMSPKARAEFLKNGGKLTD